MQRARDAGAVVVGELGDRRHYVVEVLCGDLVLAEHDLAVGVACGRLTAEVEHDLKQVVGRRFAERVGDAHGERLEQQLDLA